MAKMVIKRVFRTSQIAICPALACLLNKTKTEEWPRNGF